MIPAVPLFRSAPALGLCLFLALLTSRCAAAMLYVSPLGSDDNSGTDASPYKTIQAAVNNASSGDTISLAYAIYQGNGNRDIDFAGKSLSIISGGGPGKAIIDCQGTQQEVHRAFYLHSKEANVVFAGLTIKNSTDEGAIRIEQDCSVKFNKCAFRDNTGVCVLNHGAVTLIECLFLSNPQSGCVFNYGTAALTRCNFSGNTTQRYDSSVCTNIANGIATLTDCTFTGNTGYEGGSIYNLNTAVLKGCTFTGNTSTGGDGGGGISNNGTATLTNCTFTGNTGSRGGGISNGGGTATLTNCIFTGNSSSRETGGGYISGGGGVYNGGTVTLTNCDIFGNTSISNGGGIYNSGSDAHVIVRFCSISGNIVKPATNGGPVAQGGALENDGTATLTDDVLWGNTAPYANEIATPMNGRQTTTVSYCDIQGGLSGTGNIKNNPGFMDAASGDLHLQAGSPCRGAGITIPPVKANPNQYNSQADPGVSTDADGKHRPSPPSIGAYEYSASAALHKKPLLDIARLATRSTAVSPPDAPTPDVAAPDVAAPAPAGGAATAVSQPRPKLWPAEQQQENAAFLQLMVTLNTNHYGSADMAQRIQAELDKGADINVKDSEGFPAIVTAASLAHTDVVQALLEHGADQNAVTAQVDKSSATDSASILHKTASGYQVNVGDAITSLFAKKPKPLFGQTALMFAAQTGQADMVTLLLKHGADAGAKDSRGKTALDYANQDNHSEIVELLKAH